MQAKICGGKQFGNNCLKDGKKDWHYYERKNILV
jgi:hypothetical protein